MRTVDLKLEVVVIPVADVDRAKRFYGDQLGWRLDADFVAGKEFRGVQVTPPGSQASIHFGKGITASAPGSARGYLIVSDIEAARAELVDRGVAVSEIVHGAPGQPPAKGRDPQRGSYLSLATFSDPDGNTWVLQEVTTRLPGRVAGDETTYGSLSDLANAMRRAESAHGEHEKRLGQRDADWPTWYASYMIAEQLGKPLPT
ncbi:MAG TPA: VOC family protein [Steroidobacteraceae bacterium]|nr:VOC family protein [Steroidobacteraceae bacterium]